MSSYPVTGGWQRERAGVTTVGYGIGGTAAGLVIIGLLSGQLIVGVVMVGVAAGLMALVWVDIAGLRAYRWLELGLRWQIAHLAGRTSLRSGAVAPRRRAAPADDPPQDLPGPLSSHRWIDAPDGRGERFAVVADELDRTWTAVLGVSYPGLSLAEGSKRAQRVEGWGQVLADYCVDQTPVARLGVYQRVWPDDGGALTAWYQANEDPTTPKRARRNMADLLERAVPATSRRESFLAVTISARRASGEIRAAGGGDQGAAAVLAQVLAVLERRLGQAEVMVTEWLGPRRLAEVVRTAYDPEHLRHLDRRAAAAARPGWGGLPAGVDPALAGPVAAEDGWSTYRHDSATSVAWHVRAWPRAQVPVSFLTEILRPRPTARRCFALVLEPIGARDARGVMVRSRSRQAAQSMFRRRTGRLESPEEQIEYERSLAQDRARAEGAGLVRFSGYYAVTVTDPAVLDREVAEAESAASGGHMDIRRLWGAQSAGFVAACLPLCTGLEGRRPWL